MRQSGRVAGLPSIADHGLLRMPEIVSNDGLVNVVWPVAPVAADLTGRLREPCPRCKGRMLDTGTEGDLSCFTCGHSIYAVAPELDLQNKQRPPSSGGSRLD